MSGYQMNSQNQSHLHTLYHFNKKDIEKNIENNFIIHFMKDTIVTYWPPAELSK